MWVRTHFGYLFIFDFSLKIVDKSFGQLKNYIFVVSFIASSILIYYTNDEN